MAKRTNLDILPPNDRDGSHRRRGERIERRTVEIGNGESMDFITDCTLVECEVRINCSARAVNLFGSTFELCVFRPKRELNSLRFSTTVLRGCTFLGKYKGCRFGRELPDDTADIRDCDFSKATVFHLCDCLEGADVGSLRWPPWPHVVVTDLPRSRADWLTLELPPDLRLVQRMIGSEDSVARAVAIYLPAETRDLEPLRELLGSRPYMIIAESHVADDRDGT